MIGEMQRATARGAMVVLSGASGGRRRGCGKRSAPHHAKMQETITAVTQQQMGLPPRRTVRCWAPHRVHRECHERHDRERDGPPRKHAGHRRDDCGQRVTVVMALGTGQRGEHIRHLGEMNRCGRRARGSSGGVSRRWTLQHRHQHDRDDQQGPQHHRCHAEARAQRCAFAAGCHHFTVHLHPIPVVGIGDRVRPRRRHHGRRAAERPPRRPCGAGSRESCPAWAVRRAVSTTPV